MTVVESKEVKTGCNLAESSEEGCGSKMKVLPSTTMKIEATGTSETSVDFQRTSRPYIPEERTLHNHSCMSLKSY
jgi:hypothetical protein